MWVSSGFSPLGQPLKLIQGLPPYNRGFNRVFQRAYRGGLILDTPGAIPKPTIVPDTLAPAGGGGWDTGVDGLQHTKKKARRPQRQPHDSGGGGGSEGGWDRSKKKRKKGMKGKKRSDRRERGASGFGVSAGGAGHAAGGGTEKVGETGRRRSRTPGRDDGVDSGLEIRRGRRGAKQELESEASPGLSHQQRRQQPPRERQNRQRQEEQEQASGSAVAQEGGGERRPPPRAKSRSSTPRPSSSSSSSSSLSFSSSYVVAFFEKAALELRHSRSGRMPPSSFFQLPPTLVQEVRSRGGRPCSPAAATLPAKATARATGSAAIADGAATGALGAASSAPGDGGGDEDGGGGDGSAGSGSSRRRKRPRRSLSTAVTDKGLEASESEDGDAAGSQRRSGEPGAEEDRPVGGEGAKRRANPAVGRDSEASSAAAQRPARTTERASPGEVTGPPAKTADAAAAANDAVAGVEGGGEPVSSEATPTDDGEGGGNAVCGGPSAAPQDGSVVPPAAGSTGQRGAPGRGATAARGATAPVAKPNETRAEGEEGPPSPCRDSSQRALHSSPQNPGYAAGTVASPGARKKGKSPARLKRMAGGKSSSPVVGSGGSYGNGKVRGDGTDSSGGAGAGAVTLSPTQAVFQMLSDEEDEDGDEAYGISKKGSIASLAKRPVGSTPPPLAAAPSPSAATSKTSKRGDRGDGGRRRVSRPPGAGKARAKVKVAAAAKLTSSGAEDAEDTDADGESEAGTGAGAGGKAGKRHQEAESDARGSGGGGGGDGGAGAGAHVLPRSGGRKQRTTVSASVISCCACVGPQCGDQPS